MKKSRYQMTNRGRKGTPGWYVEDFLGKEGEPAGRYLFSSRTKSRAEGLLKTLRSAERQIERGEDKGL